MELILLLRPKLQSHIQSYPEQFIQQPKKVNMCYKDKAEFVWAVCVRSWSCRRKLSPLHCRCTGWRNGPKSSGSCSENIRRNRHRGQQRQCHFSNRNRSNDNEEVWFDAPLQHPWNLSRVINSLSCSTIWNPVILTSCSLQVETLPASSESRKKFTHSEFKPAIKHET